MAGAFSDDIGIAPKSRSTSGLLIVIIALFLIGAYYYTLDSDNVFDDHIASDDFNSLRYGIQSLAVGDIDGFLDGLVGGMVIIGLFMVMFSLFHFLFTTALKPIFQQKKYGTVLALVLSIYAFIDPRIYNYLLSLNAFTVGFLVFIAVLVMIWGFTSHAGKGVKDSFKDVQAIKRHPELLQNRENIKRLKKALEQERVQRGR